MVGPEFYLIGIDGDEGFVPAVDGMYLGNSAEYILARNPDFKKATVHEVAELANAKEWFNSVARAYTVLSATLEKKLLDLVEKTRAARNHGAGGDEVIALWNETRAFDANQQFEFALRGKLSWATGYLCRALPKDQQEEIYPSSYYDAADAYRAEFAWIASEAKKHQAAFDANEIRKLPVDAPGALLLEAIAKAENSRARIDGWAELAADIDEAIENKSAVDLAVMFQGPYGKETVKFFEHRTGLKISGKRTRPETYMFKWAGESSETFKLVDGLLQASEKNQLAVERLVEAYNAASSLRVANTGLTIGDEIDELVKKPGGCFDVIKGKGAFKYRTSTNSMSYGAWNHPDIRVFCQAAKGKSAIEVMRIIESRNAFIETSRSISATAARKLETQKIGP